MQAYSYMHTPEEHQIDLRKLCTCMLCITYNYVMYVHIKTLIIL